MNRFLAITALLGAMGVAAPALANDRWTAPHAQYHREAAQQHHYTHDRLADDEYNFHAAKNYQHWRLHATGRGYGPRHWMWHARANAQHGWEHARQGAEHATDHAAGAADHGQYHYYDSYGY